MDDIREINSQSQQALAHGDTIKVAKLDGHATVRHADGSVSALKVGMILKMGDVVITSPGVRASIQVAEGESIPCGDEKGDVLAIDKTVLDFFSDAQDFQPVDSNTVKNALDDLNKIINPDDLNNLEATAAGFDPGAVVLQSNTPIPLSFQGYNFHNPFLPWSTQFNNGAAPATPIFLNTSRVANFINTVGDVTSAKEDGYRISSNNGNEGPQDSFVLNTDPRSPNLPYFNPNNEGPGHPDINDYGLLSVRGAVQVVDANPGESLFDTPDVQVGTYGNFVFEVDPADPSKGVWTYYLAEPQGDRFGELLQDDNGKWFDGNTSGDQYTDENEVNDDYVFAANDVENSGREMMFTKEQILAVQELQNGQKVTETFGITSFDGTGETISITVEGTEDVPAIITSDITAYPDQTGNIGEGFNTFEEGVITDYSRFGTDFNTVNKTTDSYENTEDTDAGYSPGLNWAVIEETEDASELSKEGQALAEILVPEIVKTFVPR